MRSLALPLASMLLFGCTGSGEASGEGPPPSSAGLATAAPAEPPSTAQGVVIGAVVTSDAKVSILSRGGGVLRAVVRRGGIVVADGITLDELQVREPRLHAIVTSAVALRGEPGTYLDATLQHDVAAAPALLGR